ncbi:magnesium transporter [Roseibium album]|uniref:Magnesium transporter MgtE n=1 Tax=Roseibium album TaxID=311410 RepID=A0A0M6Z932_9HYPH|nr:magnesium transporter [Roseibium album]MBG6148138.1 magnesium transporter [Labrenzia sp. EL_142]MBG6158338.1 magnesium transporter [Labrenzia sp. EL_162]MBG6196649.1 magnesium transporter [Labrenzia sp. EL_159]MCR9059306.1 magnesium transporter [Paracoccaceae bacterium]CTQ58927.1 Magnesium transporter MgtE [Roseibium album]
MSSTASELEPVAWTRETSQEPLETNDDTLKAVREMIKAGKRTQIVELLKKWDPIDVMQLLTRLRLKHARKLFQWLPANPSIKVVAELRPEFRSILMEATTLDQFRDILAGLDPEDATEILNEFPDDVADELIARLPDVEEIATRASYADDTAGRVMARKFVALREDCTAGEAVEQMREEADRIRKVFTVYVTDFDGKLTGTVEVGKLLLAPDEQTLGKLMNRDVIAVSTDTDQEEVLRLARKRDMRTVPVVSGEGHLIGRITPKQLTRIAADEANEDMLLMSGVSGEARSDDTVFRIVRGRLPWLLAGLVGASVAATVVGSYEDQLAEAAILAAFIPVTMSMAGNAGLQASAVAVQGIATGALWSGDILFRLVKEFFAALFNGAVAGVILAALVLIASMIVPLEAPGRLAIATSLSLLCVTTLAAMVGATVPIILDKIGIDPAMAIGVFITSSNDVLGVLIFFLMATTFYMS